MIKTAGDKQAGFTLIELLVTIAIIIIFATIAVPGFQSFIASNRATADFNQMMTSLQFARSEAAKRRQDVSAEISTTDGVWKVQVSYVNESGDTVVAREREASDDTVTVSPTGTIVFNALGRRDACFGGADCVISIGGSPSEIAIYLSGNIEKRPIP